MTRPGIDVFLFMRLFYVRTIFKYVVRIINPATMTYRGRMEGNWEPWSSRNHLDSRIFPDQTYLDQASTWDPCDTSKCLQGMLSPVEEERNPKRSYFFSKYIWFPGEFAVFLVDFQGRNERKNYIPEAIKYFKAKSTNLFLFFYRCLWRWQEIFHLIRHLMVVTLIFFNVHLKDLLKGIQDWQDWCGQHFQRRISRTLWPSYCHYRSLIMLFCFCLWINDVKSRNFKTTLEIEKCEEWIRYVGKFFFFKSIFALSVSFDTPLSIHICCLEGFDQMRLKLPRVEKKIWL